VTWYQSVNREWTLRLIADSVIPITYNSKNYNSHYSMKGSNTQAPDDGNNDNNNDNNNNNDNSNNNDNQNNNNDDDVEEYVVDNTNWMNVDKRTDIASQTKVTRYTS